MTEKNSKALVPVNQVSSACLIYGKEGHSPLECTLSAPVESLVSEVNYAHNQGVFPRVTILLGEIIPTYHIKMPTSKAILKQFSRIMPKQPSKISDPKVIFNIHNNIIKQISKMLLPATVSLK
jgi:hypothetical protein